MTSGLLGVLLGASISFYIARHSVRFTESIRLFSEMKDRLRVCLLSIKSSDNCPSDIIENCIVETKPILTQLKSFSKESNIKKITPVWIAFAYGDTPKHHDDRDTTFEYFSETGNVKETKKKAIERIEKILKLKI